MKIICTLAEKMDENPYIGAPRSSFGIYCDMDSIITDAKCPKAGRLFWGKPLNFEKTKKTLSFFEMYAIIYCRGSIVSLDLVSD